MKAISTCHTHIHGATKGGVLLLLLLACVWMLPHKASGQTLGIKTNALYWGTVTPNIGFELATSPKWSVEVVGGYHPWEWGTDRPMIKHWAAQSEVRYWLCEVFEGHFFGLHAQGGEFNINRMSLPGFVFGSNSSDYRFQGFFVGAGLSYGYQWILSNRWLLEANVGLGYNFVRYEKFESEECGCSEGWFTPSPGYFGPTKLGISFMYLIK